MDFKMRWYAFEINMWATWSCVLLTSIGMCGYNRRTVQVAVDWGHTWNQTQTMHNNRQNWKSGAKNNSTKSVIQKKKKKREKDSG